MNNGKPSYWQGGYDDDDDDEPIADYRPINSNKTNNVDELRRQQNRILEHQDEGLEALSKVIGRQKHLALRIGDEFDEQSGKFQNLLHHLTPIEMKKKKKTNKIFHFRNYR